VEVLGSVRPKGQQGKSAPKCLGPLFLGLLGLASGAPAQESRELLAAHRWLNFPISNDAPVQTLRILADGAVIRVFPAQLAAGAPQWWSSLDIGAWNGGRLTLQYDGPSAGPARLAGVDESDSSKETDSTLYREALRPQFHFSARRGWLNDPNGPIYWKGEYHLFFQHNPFTWRNSGKHWGHAVSADLVHWQEVDEALYPDEKGQMYSGSAVTDPENRSGLVAGSTEPLVLIYTTSGHGATQCLAATNDGRRFVKYAGNPILPPIATPNRDPKVFWHQPTHRWVMLLYVGIPDPKQPDDAHNFHDQHTVRIYVSDDLRTWRQTDEIRGGKGRDYLLFECPDLFPIKVAGRPNEAKWILQGGSGEYLIGAFDGEKFTAEGGPLMGRKGDFYAAETFNNLPPNRVVQIGWMRDVTPGMPFNQCLSVPLELSLRPTSSGLRLSYAPVAELQQLRGIPLALRDTWVQPGSDPLQGWATEGCDVEAELNPSGAARLAFDLGGSSLEYDVAKATLRCRNWSAAVPLEHGMLRLRFLLDRNLLDVFAMNGMVYLPIVLPGAGPRHLRFSAEGGPVRIETLKAFPMRTSWPSPP